MIRFKIMYTYKNMLRKRFVEICHFNLYKYVIEVHTRTWLQEQTF